VFEARSPTWGRTVLEDRKYLRQEHTTIMRNLEVKANASSVQAMRARLRATPGAKLQPIVHQTDWYFRTPAGRMKLRECAVAGARAAELILYQRPDTRKARTSHFVRLPVERPAETRRLLIRMCGLRVKVRKRREVWLFKNARIHLDRVSGLGSFVEIEVVVTRGMPQARRLMKLLVSTLGIQPADMLARSYADLLISARQ
jgi:predicted adenylyl cyclase CyaB